MGEPPEGGKQVPGFAIQSAQRPITTKRPTRAIPNTIKPPYSDHSCGFQAAPTGFATSRCARLWEGDLGARGGRRNRWPGYAILGRKKDFSVLDGEKRQAPLGIRPFSAELNFPTTRVLDRGRLGAGAAAKVRACANPHSSGR